MELGEGKQHRLPNPAAKHVTQPQRAGSCAAFAAPAPVLAVAADSWGSVVTAAQRDEGGGHRGRPHAAQNPTAKGVGEKCKPLRAPGLSRLGYGRAEKEEEIFGKSGVS